MSVYDVGKTVFVEAVVESYTPGKPFGAVTVRIPGSTDPDGVLDVVQAIVPEPLAIPSDEVEILTPYSGERDEFTDPDDYYGSYYEGASPWT